MYIARPAFAHTSGPRPCKLLLLGEAWGESEDIVKRPFAGESGKLLFELLGEALPDLFPELHQDATKMFQYGLAWVRHRDAWLEATGIAMTNVLALRPPDNKLEALCSDKKEAGPGYPYNPAAKGKYLRAEYFPELQRLREEIEILRPNLVVALGNTACWAMLNATNIGSIRGTIAAAVAGAPASVAGGQGVLKVLPTYHPAAVLRQWSWRTIVVADLVKAWREAQFPEIKRPERQIVINPTLAELETWLAEFKRHPPRLLSVDIETGAGLIKCVGFSGHRNAALVVPFFVNGYQHYWQHPGEELRAWQIVKELLESPVPKLGQNLLYDLQYLMKMSIRPRACMQDTMLLHHSHYPEMQKGLGFLGSIYTNEASWKLMARKKPDSVKRDE